MGPPAGEIRSSALRVVIASGDRLPPWPTRRDAYGPVLGTSSPFIRPPSPVSALAGRDSLKSLDVYAPWGKDMAEETEKISKGLVEGVIDALTDKHSQLDLRLRGLTLSLGDSRLSLRVSGDVTLAVHMRDLTEDEKAAHVASNVESIRS